MAACFGGVVRRSVFASLTAECSTASMPEAFQIGSARPLRAQALSTAGRLASFLRMLSFCNRESNVCGLRLLHVSFKDGLHIEST